MTRPLEVLGEAATASLESKRCGVCHEAIPADELIDHPHISVCLECMSEAQREALEWDLQAAARVQRQMLPARKIREAGWEFAYLWEPHGAVSGDHIDVLRPGRADDPVHVFLGDVAGKGLAASLLQSNLHALFRALAPDEASLSTLFERAGRLFFQATSAESYATLTGLRLFRDGNAEIANAGHPRPLIADRRGVRPVEDASLPLGMFEGAAYPSRKLRLRPGDTLLLYTDGWIEAEAAGEMYGVGRAAAAFRRYRHLSLPELLAAVRDDVDRFLSGTPRNDDLTLVALRRSPDDS